jgi:tRNA(fMet)-specific endonuclease VapC
MIYLLDSNAWILYMRQTDPQLVRKVQSQPRGDVGLCSVVLGELYYGAFHSSPAQQARHLNLVVQLRNLFPSAPFDDASAEIYGRIRADLAAKGMLIGPNDLMITAIALTHGLIVVTHNTAEFSRVAGLTLEDWQTP